MMLSHSSGSRGGPPFKDKQVTELYLQLQTCTLFCLVFRGTSLYLNRLIVCGLKVVLYLFIYIAT